MMKIEDTIRAWKDPEFRKNSGMSMDHPAGSTEVGDSLLRKLGGGTVRAITRSVPCIGGPTWDDCGGTNHPGHCAHPG